MIEIPHEAVRDALNGDFEFRHAARYWDASVRLGIGDAPLCVRIVQGEVAEIRPWQTADTPDIGIDAPDSEWKELLAPVPRPFYQSLFAAAAHHGVVLSGDPMDSYAYMGALARMLDVIRGRVEFR
jgi:hypothetical protein